MTADKLRMANKEDTPKFRVGHSGIRDASPSPPARSPARPSLSRSWSALLAALPLPAGPRPSPHPIVSQTPFATTSNFAGHAAWRRRHCQPLPGGDSFRLSPYARASLSPLVSRSHPRPPHHQGSSCLSCLGQPPAPWRLQAVTVPALALAGLFPLGPSSRHSFFARRRGLAPPIPCRDASRVGKCRRHASRPRPTDGADPRQRW